MHLPGMYVATAVVVATSPKAAKQMVIDVAKFGQYLDQRGRYQKVHGYVLPERLVVEELAQRAGQEFTVGVVALQSSEEYIT
jgi:hypothetical protein